ncbi:putative Protein kinase [[Clostridium] ultunense Esp]|uniref:Protein kinase domain-containing protein n=1 Tax=[Clostridium] ultunense Esp TaxID=1288971 RepID=M1ZLJ8_9FIRM|nr:AarF/UbiB family protein [Schnuerera ultunensis]CCQ97327.1 putative Protein kinase [[Clostridium] ultunense Esp]SHD78387.1 conserved protein of unknown function [[Clostridium] ultunense Esp]
MIISGKWNGREYKLLNLIGSGSFGRVYRVIDEEGNIKAIKISEDLFSITNEYNAMVRLNGLSFIPRAYDFDDWHIRGQIYHFIVMDYIQGKNLKEVGSSNEISSKTVFKIGKILINILERINGLGYRYTDIKLENILIDVKGKIYFVDFGSLTEEGMPTKEYTPSYNINSWKTEYNANYERSILFSVTMVMVSLIGQKEYNPLVFNLEQVIDRIDKFPLKRKEKQFLADGLRGKFFNLSQYIDSLVLLLKDEKNCNSLNKIDYILIASIVSFVFVIILGVKSILS